MQWQVLFAGNDQFKAKCRVNGDTIYDALLNADTAKEAFQKLTIEKLEIVGVTREDA